MDSYIGIEMVQAKPCKAWVPVDGYKQGEPGYSVIYPNGYSKWSPKDIFEKTYLKVTNNPHMKTSAPSISQEMVDDFIAHTEVITMGDKNTVVRAVLKNGFEIVESSACVSAENYDEAYGAKICMEKIKDKVWILLGFLLQTAIHGITYNESNQRE